MLAHNLGSRQHNAPVRNNHENKLGWISTILRIAHGPNWASGKLVTIKISHCYNVYRKGCNSYKQCVVSILLQHIFVVTILLQHIILVTMRIGCNNVKIKYLLLQRLINVVTQIFVATMHGSTWLHLAPLGSYMFLLILYRLLLTLYWLSTGLLQICHVSEQLRTAGNIQSYMMYGLDWITDHHYS